MNCLDFCLVVAVPSFVAESPGTSSMEQLVNTEGVPRPSGVYHSQETQGKARATPQHRGCTKAFWPNIHKKPEVRLEQLLNTEGVPRPSGLYHSQETQDKARETPLHSEWTKILWPETITRNLIKARATPQHRG